MKTLCKRLPENGARTGLWPALAALLLAAGIQAALNFSGAELPQRSADSLFTLISDDTRQVVSQAMLDKADEYFHGGLRVADCTMDHAAEPVPHGAAGHDCGNHCSHAPEHRRGFPPFAWINAHIHAQEHRHLSDERSVELLPWIVAATRTSPRNSQAYEIGSYILNRMTDTPQVAIDFLKEGIRNNPDSPELEVSLAEIYCNTVKDKEQAAAGFERALAKTLARSGERTEDDLLLRLKIYFYIGVIARERNDIDTLRAMTQQATELKKENVMTRSLAAWLAEAESGKKE